MTLCLNPKIPETKAANILNLLNSNKMREGKYRKSRVETSNQRWLDQATSPEAAVGLLRCITVCLVILKFYGLNMPQVCLCVYIYLYTHTDIHIYVYTYLSKVLPCWWQIRVDNPSINYLFIFCNGLKGRLGLFLKSSP